ncbi:hypothetical protein Fmac_019231 [Flemingia macrophylla]|uniref:Uncharacterized protein n=1 Tax=Flemingia macrophylla TaxID=520843 RepID=A0ABD1M770_9FABA
MQINFFWRGNKDIKKIPWIYWAKIAQPKRNDGLGVKNLEISTLPFFLNEDGIFSINQTLFKEEYSCLNIVLFLMSR